jgi:tripeptide aminopeptidase
MPKTSRLFDPERAVKRLMEFLSVEGITGQEKAIAQAIKQSLVNVGVPLRAIRFDRANEEIPLPTQTGNLIVTLPGTLPGPRRLLIAHMDTVPLCAGARPVRRGSRIVAAGKTALSGDDRTGVACLVNMIATLFEKNLSHGPLTVLFTVREESGLWGARYVKPADLGHPAEAFNVDGGSASEMTVGAVGAERWSVEIRGRAAHAGVHPEQGISATMVGSLALAQVQKAGWFGKIRLDGRDGTSNVGSFGGESCASAGVATNVVTDYVAIQGESRSHDIRFVRKITKAYQEAFRKAAGQLPNDKGAQAKVRFRIRRDYYPFRLKENTPVVQHARSAAASLGMKPGLRVTNGGLDANWMVRHGIPTVTFGAGQNNIHTVDEFVDIEEFIRGCDLALALATRI